MITLDTSGLYALANRRDRHHAAAVKALETDPGPYLVPAGILAEVAYLFEQRLGLPVLDSFLADLISGSYSLDCGESALPRTRELVQRYADLELGFADASVVACAERHRGRVLTFDRRDFGAVAAEGTITLVPE